MQHDFIIIDVSHALVARFDRNVVFYKKVAAAASARIPCW